MSMDKKKKYIFAAVAAAFFLSLIGLSGKAAAKDEKPRAFSLYSKAFAAGGTIPERYTCDGKDVSPKLVWTAPPKGTKYYVLIMEDPDAPGGNWIHWLIYDLPVRVRQLPEGLTKKESLPTGAKQGACWGTNVFEKVGYWGPCPPPGPAHNYVFSLYALAAPTGLKPRATKDQVVEKMRGHILGRTELIGLYGR